jgi:hypothetical protein
MVVFLASEACQLTQHVFTAGASRYSRVFLGLTHGWVAPQNQVCATEDIAAHIGEITDTAQFTIPQSLADEIDQLVARVGLA